MSKRPHVLSHLAWIWGPHSAVWAVSLSTTELIPRSLTARLDPPGIRSLIAFSTAVRGHQAFSALPPKGTPDASPKAISRRTSYPPTRLEFLRYPQLIRGHCNERRFGPPADFTPLSSWPWIDRRASGLRMRTGAQLRLGFPVAPALRLNRARTRNSPAHSSIGTSSGLNALRLVVGMRFQILFTPLPGFFSPFPHGTGALSVTS